MRYNRPVNALPDKSGVSESSENQIKIGVRQGDGPDPGYVWNVAILDYAFTEVSKFFTTAEYQHMEIQVK